MRDMSARLLIQAGGMISGSPLLSRYSLLPSPYFSPLSLFCSPPSLTTVPLLPSPLFPSPPSLLHLSQHAGVAMSAFIRALYETNLAGILRYVWRNNSQPKLTAIVPHIKADYQV